MSAPNRKLRLFRILNGRRVPYTIELDNELTVIAEYADTTDLDHVAQGRSTRVLGEQSEARKKALTMSRWSTKAIEQNPIPGTEDLRDEYFEDLDTLNAKHVLEGTKCPPCEVGKLMRRYREKLEKGGWL